MTKAEREYLKIDNPYQNYYQVLADATEMRFTKGEITVVCTGFGFENTQELRVMKYNEAMAE